MLLYRGFSDPIVAGVLKNQYLKIPRKPKDSHTHVHNVADNWFKNKLGVKARSQAIFCTPDIEQAKEYGQPYKITVPQHLNYKLIYSIDVKDFIEIEADINDLYDTEKILNWLESKSYVVVYSFSHLPENLDVEVMLFCEQYEILED
ncbi:hypothetical protein CTM76_17015 [Photobacterium phosphoreum]|uniref:hypothetical protein n=1 Tax=Photobacterium phosphoreum TaxID=659 RepID=UPI0007F88882|nr:hypothetical protein [Photobacterium phosphoreum]OBU41670.1 hypothetical protein AYY25_00970 [Photobacterium phosphoreum]PSU76091.1 hypothetical protein CTM76_17015 [Photobacterium phosphoreum]